VVTIPFEGYMPLLDALAGLPDVDRRAKCRNLCRTNLYFLLRYGCRRPDLEHRWFYDRCNEVQADCNEHLDLWSREHGKSSLITFGLTIMDILQSHGEDPLPDWGGIEPTFGIFSHTRPVAKGFLRQIKRELETNVLLKELFPDILWAHPQKESPKWSEDDGIVVKRRGNPKESTVEAWGLVDGQPTGKHFFVLVYDDVVVKESVSTPEMIRKTTEAMELSFNLGTQGGIRRAAGTRYHFNDTYRTLIERQTFSLRKYPATRDGKADGEPVLWSRETLAEKRRDMGPYTFACQILLDPKADDVQGFRREWLRHYKAANAGKGLNKYVLVDPASSRKDSADYTSMWVVGLGPDQNLYVLDIIRDRLSLTERADAVMRLHRKWRPLEVRYEEYGLQADIEHIQDMQEREQHRFRIQKVGGRVSKEDRIKRLVPMFEQGRIWLPEALYVPNREGRSENLVDAFIEQEYLAFPVGAHDDMLDALSRIAEPEMPLKWPVKSDRDLAMQSVEPWVALDPGIGM
jgi:predicted phage terminase large subunit-like protein